MKELTYLFTCWSGQLSCLEAKQGKDFLHSINVFLDIWKIDDSGIGGAEVQIALNAVVFARDDYSFLNIRFEEASRLLLN